MAVTSKERRAIVDCPALSLLIQKERAMGLEPTTSSLGSGTKLRGALRNAPRINGVRPAYFSTRQDVSAYSSLNGNQR